MVQHTSDPDAEATPDMPDTGLLDNHPDGPRTLFVEWIDRLIVMCHEQGRYVSDDQRDEVVDVLRDGQQHYRTIALA